MKNSKRSRNGCARCKRQRLKCDENKPACGRCTRNNVQCPGYDNNLKWSTKYEVLTDGLEAEQQRRLDGQRPSKWPGALFESFNSWQVSPVHGNMQPDLDEFDAFAERSWLVDKSSITGGQNELFTDEYNVGWSDSSQIADVTDSSSMLSSLPNYGGIDGLLDPGTIDPVLTMSGLLQTTPVSADLMPLPLPVNSRRGTDDSSTQDPGTSQAARPFLQPQGHTIDRTEASGGPSRNILSPRPSRGLVTQSSLLMDFYFKETAQMFSCFDSEKNPFRSTVSKLWTSSPVIHSTLQSMAASCLVESFPQMKRLGRTLRMEAVTNLPKDCTGDQTLLALLMLGGTANWSDSGDLGVTMFNAFKRKLTFVSQMASSTENLLFFQNSLIYWEMLLCYVSDAVDASPVQLIDGIGPHFPSKHIPHPWTGISREIHLILQEVGRLIRRQRLQAHSRAFASRAHIRRLQQAMEAAEDLEKRLMDVNIPAEVDVLSPDDRATPVWHLLELAEVYRRTGLIQLYHVFPDLLAKRLAGQDARKNADVFQTTATDDHQGQVEWLTQFAIDTLTVLKTIPIESGTRDFQPFLLVALCSELRLPLSSSSSEVEDEYLLLGATSRAPSPGVGMSANRRLDFTSRAIEVVRMRDFVYGRLKAFVHVLPPSPIRVCLELVKKTWAQMDDAAVTLNERRDMSWEHNNNGENDDEIDDEAPSHVYWMDVMIENGWEFVV